jgi:hypothetical protein
MFLAGPSEAWPSVTFRLRWPVRGESSLTASISSVAVCVIWTRRRLTHDNWPSAALVATLIISFNYADIILFSQRLGQNTCVITTFVGRLIEKWTDTLSTPPSIHTPLSPLYRSYQNNSNPILFHTILSWTPFPHNFISMLMFMHVHADWLKWIIKNRTNYNADHFQKPIMQKTVRFVKSTASEKLLGWAVSEIILVQNFSLGYSYMNLLRTLGFQCE